MTVTNAERVRLHTELVAQFAGLLDPSRVHLYVPGNIASPCVWIAQPSYDTVVRGQPGAVMTIISFPVVIVPFGYEPRQAEMNDEMVDRVWDAAVTLTRGEPSGARPAPIDVGGATQRGVIVDVEMTVTARTFCLPKTTRPPLLTVNGADHG